MTLGDKFKQYFEDSGVQKSKFAKKIGISPALFYQVLYGAQLLPVKCWKKTVEFTGGAITMSDLMKDKLSKSPYMEVVETKNPWRCEVRIKGSQ